MYRQGLYDIPTEIFERDKAAYKPLLSRRYFNILEMRAGQQMTYKAIGEHYNLSPERIRQICSRAKEKIQEARYTVS